MVNPEPTPRPRRGDLTIATVARLAGVSVPTVSKVINGRTGVAAATRRRIEAILHEKGYRRPQTIGPVPILEVAFRALESHLAVEILRGVERVARERELAVGFTEIQGRGNPGRHWMEQVLARRPTGVIAVYFDFDTQQQARLATSSIPLVAVDPTGEPLHDTPSVGATNWSGGLAATRHLLGLGHRRIGMINGPTEFLCARARLDGYRAALHGAAVPFSPGLVRRGRFCFEDGLQQGVALLELSPRPTAIFAANDLQALGVYAAAHRLGLRIPQDLSVVGFDDVEFGQWVTPPLTTIRQPLAEMGAVAAEIVVALAAGRQPAQTRIELATTLVERQSTAPPSGLD
ncbi:MAG TPA: LacI family DNA-binding transcriptional regulator [Candidatus Limnocylindrales bacterium]